VFRFSRILLLLLRVSCCSSNMISMSWCALILCFYFLLLKNITFYFPVIYNTN
jgi:hypothetical protein